MSRNKPLSLINTFFDSFGFKRLNDRTKSIDLIRNSKQLILNNQKYEKYTNYYTQLTNTFSFKQPDISDYPLQKNHCIISVQKNHKLNNKKTNIVSYLVKHYPIIHTENNISKSRRLILNESLDNQKSNCINEGRLLNLIDQFNDMNSVIYKYINYKEKYFLIDRSNHSVLSELLKNNNYTHEVFKKPGKKENSFNVKDDNINITLKCNSIKLLFYIIQFNTDNSNKETTKKIYKKTQEILFPFELIPMFYGLSFEDLKLFLSLIIFYDNDNKIFIINNNVFDKYYLLFRNTKELFKENCLFCKLNNKDNLIQLEHSWITNDNRYIAKIKLPHFLFRISYLTNHQLPINIEKSICIQHLSYFINGEFKDWDLFLMNSFCGFKVFRNVVNRAFSKNPLKHPQKKIMLGFSQTKPIEDLLDTWNFFYSHKDGNGSYIQFNPLKIILHFYETDNHNEESRTFELSMKQTQQLLRLRSLFSIDELLQRCIVFDNKLESTCNTNRINVSFCYKTIDLFDDSYCRYLIEQKDSIEMNTVVKKERTYDIFFIEPSLEWKYEVMGDLNKKTHFFPKDISEAIMNLPIREWDAFFQSKIPQIFDETFICKDSHENTDYKKKINNPKRKMTSKIRLKTIGRKTVTIDNLNKRLKSLLN